jgi:hypothetical protein
MDNVTVSFDTSVVFRIMGDESKGEDPELVRSFVHEVLECNKESQPYQSVKRGSMLFFWPLIPTHPTSPLSRPFPELENVTCVKCGGCTCFECDGCLTSMCR